MREKFYHAFSDSATHNALRLVVLCFTGIVWYITQSEVYVSWWLQGIAIALASTVVHNALQEYVQNPRPEWDLAEDAEGHDWYKAVQVGWDHIWNYSFGTCNDVLVTCIGEGNREVREASVTLEPLKILDRVENLIDMLNAASVFSLKLFIS
jgi:hypothetical protein